MPNRLTDSRLANLGAHAIFQAFCRYQEAFQEITARGKPHFEAMNWHGIQADAAERLNLYRQIVDALVLETRVLLDDRLENKMVWAGLKAVYSGIIVGQDNWELAETFFNSVTRRIFTTVGINPQIEFVDTDFEMPPTGRQQPVYRSYRDIRETEVLIRNILVEMAFKAAFRNIDQDAALAAELVEAHLQRIGALKMVDRAEVVRAVFFRSKGAYVIGRMFSGSHTFPLVLALMNSPKGIYLDAVLLEENDVSILFSFTRSYFHIDIDRAYHLTQFLKSIMPRKKTAELYISLGYNKHGKTGLYRDLRHHLSHSSEKFIEAPGKKGMVMIVFTLPGYDVVFKLIRDQFAYPKKIDRQTVMDKYRMVFRHDRAGRLVDAQEFEHLQFKRERFSDELLNALLEAAGQTVAMDDDKVIIKHAYVERRVIPLDIYAREADLEAAKRAAIDYGYAIKEMAATNIFPGDMLLKNFGVTRHGRVVFYDYDELCLLTDCNFRHPPKAPDLTKGLPDPSWFVIGKDDVFPTEFRHFLGLGGVLFQTFYEHHADIFEVDFWKNLQESIKKGEIMHIFPYPQEKRLKI